MFAAGRVALAVRVAVVLALALLATPPPFVSAAPMRGASARAVPARAGSMFVVGTSARPLIARGPVGPLWVASARHAPDLAMASALAATVTTSPSVLTTAQATARLTARCRKLIATKARTLRRADRRRRVRCLAQRRRLVAASLQAAHAAPTRTPSPTAAAPAAAPIVVPAPTPVAATTPQPTSPPPTTTPATTPIDPSTVLCSAIGITAIDIEPFQLTRDVVCPSDRTGLVSVEFTNRDAQVHGIAIEPAGAGAKVVPTVIVGSLSPGSSPVGVTVKLAPGQYTLLCTVTAHDPAMEVGLTVLTKADFIAQGYAG